MTLQLCQHLALQATSGEFDDCERRRLGVLLPIQSDTDQSEVALVTRIFRSLCN